VTDDDGQTSFNYEVPVSGTGESAAAGGSQYPRTTDHNVLADQFAHFAQNWHGFKQEKSQAIRKQRRRETRTASDTEGSGSEDEREIEGPEGFLYPENDGDNMHRQGEPHTGKIICQFLWLIEAMI